MSWYQKQWNALEGWKLCLFVIASYTFLFLVLQLGVFGAFYASGTSFVWNVDGIGQHYPRLLYVCRTVHQTLRSLFSGKGLDFQLIDFHQGVASRGLNQFVLPEILAAVLPQSKVDLFYTILVLGQYYAAGLSFIIMVLYFKVDAFAAVIGAIIYSFCGFGLFGVVRHFSFGLPMVHLPLLIVGIDKVLHRKSGWLLLCITFFSLSRGLYFSCMIAMLCFVFATVRFFDVCHVYRIREAALFAGRLAVWVILAVLLSGVFVIPELGTMSDTGRIGNDVFSYADPCMYNTKYYERFLSYFMTEANGGTGGGSAWTYLAYTVLSVPAICLLFARRRKNERTLKILFILLTAMLGIPAISYMMSGFSNFSNRFIFGYSLCVSAIVAFMISGLNENTKKDYTGTGIILVIYLALCEVLIAPANRRSEAIVFMLLALALIILVRLTTRNAIWLKLTLLGVVCVSVLYTSGRLYASPERNYVSEFVADPKAVYQNNQYQALSSSKAVKNDPAFFRSTGNALINDDLNMAFYYDLYDMTGYPSTGASVLYRKWLNELEVPYYDSYHRFFGLDSRAALLTMTSNKYYAVRDSGNGIVPYGYNQIDKKTNKNKETDTIYQNDHWLPVGYTYDRYILREQYDQLMPLKKQEAQLQAAILEYAPKSGIINPADLYFTVNGIPCEIVEMNSVSFSKGKLTVKKDGGTIVLACERQPETETYLRIKDLDLTSGTSERVWYVQAESDLDTSGLACFYTDYNAYSHMQHTQTINLGYSEEGISRITITFPMKGTCKLSGFEVYSQPMAAYDEQVYLLGREALQNIKTTGYSLEGTISVASDKILCTSIPYLNDWEAFVDGKPAELYHVNTAFIGVELPAGDHTVRFIYHQRGQKLGLIVSGVGLICLLAIIVVRKKRKQREGAMLQEQ